jgi:hypothetical protein
VKLGLAIEEIHTDERELVEQLLRVGERHRADHEIHHLTQLLARMSEGHADALVPFAERYGADLETGGVSDKSRSGLLDRVREKGSELVGRRPDAGLLLLRDLRELHVEHTKVSVGWVILGQAAQAAKDQELLSTVSGCHAETLRGLKWTTTHVKQVAPQALMS